MKKNQKVKSNQKIINLPQLAWMGFNYVLGMGFLVTIFSVFNYTGLHSIWILILTGVIVGGSGLAFMRNAQIYSEINGGASEYNHRSFGVFMGWAVGFLQWTLGPIATSVNVLILLEFSLRGVVDPNIWGEYTFLYLRLISIGIFIILWLIVISGIKHFKLAVNFISIIKWILMITVLVSAIVIIDQSSGKNYFNLIEYGELSAINFNASFLLFFYGFAGFDSFVVMAKNVKNPKKSIPKAVWISIVGAGIFYIIALSLIIGTISGPIDDKTVNPINYLIALAFGSSALILSVLAQISSRITTDIQTPLFMGAYIQGLAEHNYLPSYLAKINSKTNIPRRALIFNFVLVMIVAFIWLILPFFTNFKIDSLQSGITLYSIVTLLVYISVIASALKLYFSKQIKVRLWEPILWIVTELFLIVQVVIYFIRYEDNLNGIILLVVTLLFILIWYFSFIKNRFFTKKNLQKNIKK